MKGERLKLALQRATKELCCRDESLPCIVPTKEALIQGLKTKDKKTREGR